MEQFVNQPGNTHLCLETQLKAPPVASLAGNHPSVGTPLPLSSRLQAPPGQSMLIILESPGPGFGWLINNCWLNKRMATFHALVLRCEIVNIAISIAALLKRRRLASRRRIADGCALLCLASSPSGSVSNSNPVFQM